MKNALLALSGIFAVLFASGVSLAGCGTDDDDDDGRGGERPDAPTGLQAVAGDRAVTLSWKAP